MSTREYRQSTLGRETTQRYRHKPEVKAKEAEWQQQYNRTDAGKDRHRRFRNTEHYKVVSHAQYRRYSQTIRGRAGLLCAAAKKRAKARNLPFTLTIDIVEAYLTKLNGKCEVTGMDFNFAPKHPNAPSLDQKVPGLGYTEDNIQIVTWWYNRLKSDLSDIEARQILRQIQKSTHVF
jgi:hypothetical protein